MIKEHVKSPLSEFLDQVIQANLLLQLSIWKFIRFLEQTFPLFMFQFQSFQRPILHLLQRIKDHFLLNIRLMYKQIFQTRKIQVLKKPFMIPPLNKFWNCFLQLLTQHLLHQISKSNFLLWTFQLPVWCLLQVNKNNFQHPFQLPTPESELGRL